MASIDITLPDELMVALTPPSCADLQLPAVLTSLPTVTLPIGGSLSAVADYTSGFPTSCSMNFSLIAQLAPIMASMECVLKILGFVTAVMQALPSMTTLVGIGSGIKKIVSAAGDLAECLGSVVPLVGQVEFVLSVLSMIANMILCLVSELERILDILSGISVSLADAEANGNDTLAASLQCAQENASAAAAATMQSMQPITALLGLAAPFMQLAGVSLNVSFPSGIDPSDTKAMRGALDTLRGIAQTIGDLPGVSVSVSA